MESGFAIGCVSGLMVFSGGMGWGEVGVWGWGGVSWGGGGACGCVRNTKALTHLHSLVKHPWALESSYCKKTYKLLI